MRVAICFFGITRNLTPKTLRSIESHLIGPVARLDPQFVRFGHFNLPGKISNARSKEKQVTLVADDHLLLQCDHLETTSQLIVDEQIDLMPYQAYGDPWKDGFCSLKNLLRQYWSLEQVTRLLERSGERFDLVIFSRADVQYRCPLHLPKIQEGVIYTPGFAQWGGLNDRFALGHQETMITYGLRGRSAVDYVRLTGKPLHAEQFLEWHVRREGLRNEDLAVRFWRVRADGRVAGLDGHLRHFYALRSRLKAWLVPARD